MKRIGFGFAALATFFVSGTLHATVKVDLQNTRSFNGGPINNDTVGSLALQWEYLTQFSGILVDLKSTHKENKCDTRNSNSFSVHTAPFALALYSLFYIND